MTQPREISKPRPGLFKLRLVRGGPWVAARIVHMAARDPVTGEALDRSPLWSAYVNDELLAEPSPDYVEAKVNRIWEYGRPIDLAEYKFLLAQHRHAARYEPNHPAADPRRAIDPLTSPPPF